MKVKHNKKRNVGLIFAQLSQYISEALVEGKIEKAKKAIDILQKHFVPGTELFREFRLFRAMMITEVPSAPLASSIITEAKTAARNLDIKLLTQQKSALIKDINYVLAEASFYSRRVEGYKEFATVQTLLSQWRSPSPDIVVSTRFESELHSYLLKEKKNQNISDLKTPHANRLVVEIMHKKIEEKYGESFSSSQIDLLREYVFSENDNAAFRAKLSSIKKSTLSSLNEYSLMCENKILSKQLSEVKMSVQTLDIEKFDDDSISKYLTLMKLTEELTTGDESNGRP
jgi:hypothetical protein